MVVLPVAIWVTISGGSLADLALTSVAGEGVALVVAGVGLNRRFAMPYGILLPPIVFAGVVLGCAFLVAERLPAAHDWLHIAAGLLAAAVVPVLALASFPGVRREVWELVRPSAAKAHQPAASPP
jgi:hypothetical protein